jgi:hypothetical protein
LGTVLDVVEEMVTITIDDARRVMSKYDALWLDKSRIYDGDGYVTVPPEWRNDHRLDEIRQELREFGTYPWPREILEFLNERFA